MLAGMAVVEGGLAGMVAASCWSLSDSEIGRLLDRLAAAQAQLAAAELGLVAEADSRGLGRADGAGSTAAWLRHRQRRHPGEASATVQLAADLRGSCGRTGEALAAGRLSAAHARTIAAALRQLPVEVPDDVRAQAQEFLIEQAAVLDPILLARAGRALAEALRTAPDADGRFQQQVAARTLTRAVAADGMVRWAGWFDAEADALLCAAIDPLAAPRPAIDGTPEPRPAGRRRADALLDLTRIALTADGLPESGGLRPTMTVTIDHRTLCERLPGSGLLDTGELMPAEAARRVACDARIIPVMLGSAGQPLDVGRAGRAIGPAIRTALNVRDAGCAFPGCEAKQAWCDGHHIKHWGDGGPTAIHNLVLLCGHHHRAVHQEGWTVTMEPDGLPSFHPPPWLHTGRPRRHHRYALRQLSLADALAATAASPGERRTTTP